jgi:hypothetical protein
MNQRQLGMNQAPIDLTNGGIMQRSPTAISSLPPCSRPSRTLRAASAVAWRRSLTAAARGYRTSVRAGTKQCWLPRGFELIE